MKTNELIQKALEQLSTDRNWTQDTAMLRGIGFALVALVQEIQKSNNGERS